MLLTSGFYHSENEMPAGLTLVRKPYKLKDVEQHIRLVLRGGDGLAG